MLLPCSAVCCPLRAGLPFLRWSAPGAAAEEDCKGKRVNGPPLGQKNASRGSICQTLGASVIEASAIWEDGALNDADTLSMHKHGISAGPEAAF